MHVELGHYPQTILLVLARTGAIVWTVPFFGGSRVPARIKTAAALVIALFLLPLVPDEWVMAALEIRTLPQMVFAILREVFLGGTIGLIAHAYVGACLLGGSLAAQSSSMMMAQTIDPIGGAQNDSMGNLLQTVFVLFVVTSNGHLALIRFLAMSFESTSELLPAGDNLLAMVISLGVSFFDWGLRLALPVVFAGLVVNVCMALAARMAPNFNILFLSMPVRVAVGLCVLGMAFRYESNAFKDLMMELLSTCGRAIV